MNEICRLDQVIKEYEESEIVRPVAGISLTLSPGSFLSVEGPSGIGKSTLLCLMGGLLRPTRGRVYLMGQDTLALNDKKLTMLRSRTVGFIFQESCLLPALTVAENIHFAAALSNSTEDDHKSRVDRLLRDVGLENRAEFLPHQLSVGQRRRASILRALVNCPPLILADEPTNDLDMNWSRVVMELLTEAAKNGSAVVVVTHNMECAKYALVRYELRDGRLVFCER